MSEELVGVLRAMLDGEKRKSFDNMGQPRQLCGDILYMMYPEDMDSSEIAPASVTLRKSWMFVTFNSNSQISKEPKHPPLQQLHQHWQGLRSRMGLIEAQVPATLKNFVDPTQTCKDTYKI